MPGRKTFGPGLWSRPFPIGPGKYKHPKKSFKAISNYSNNVGNNIENLTDCVVFKLTTELNFRALLISRLSETSCVYIEYRSYLMAD